MKVYQDWIDDPFFDEQIRTELRALKDKSEIEDRFYRDLDSVSYTHLDVYKRQPLHGGKMEHPLSRLHG